MSELIGVIVSSYLDFKAFVNVNGDDYSADNFDPTILKWAPCDGRSVKGSKYARVVSSDGVANAPELRGLFLRCVNNIYDDGNQAILDPKRMNPDSKLVTEFQDESLKEHSHNFKIETDNAGGNSHIREYVFDPNSGYNSDMSRLGETKSVGGKETRPKNVSVYYYIKIN